MKASVIIPTYNGEKKIGETLEALCKQSVHDFETIVVIDGSTDNTETVVQPFANRLSKLIVVNQPNGGRANARNRGAASSSTDLLIFIDDDIEVMPENIESHMAFHQKVSDATLLGNPSLNLNRIGKDAFLNFRAGSERRWTQNQERGLSKVSFTHYVFTSANLSLPKKLFNEIGGFDNRLTDSEDLDLSIRLLQKEKQIFLNTELACYHNDFADIALTIRRQSQYYESKVKLLALHPEYEALLPSQFEWRRKTKKDFVKKILFKSRYLWMVFFKSPLFLLLPSFVRNAAFSSLIYTHTVLKVKK